MSWKDAAKAAAAACDALGLGGEASALIYAANIDRARRGMIRADDRAWAVLRAAHAAVAAASATERAGLRALATRATAAVDALAVLGDALSTCEIEIEIST